MFGDGGSTGSYLRNVTTSTYLTLAEDGGVNGPGLGGLAANGIGDVKRSGGDGGAAGAGGGGGGGGAGTSAANGSNGSAGGAVNGGAGGKDGDNVAGGGAGGNSGSNGQNAATAGSGGGGGGLAMVSGAGLDGWGKITFTIASGGPVLYKAKLAGGMNNPNGGFDV